MKLGSRGEALIKSFEQLALKAYPDEGGIWTIGWGHTGFYAPGVPVGPGQVCTPEQAEAWFIADTANAVVGVDRCVDVALTQNQFDALVSFTYNDGVGALAHSTLLRDLNSGRADLAANEFLRWDHVGGHESAGLERRRKAEQKLFLSGDNVSGV